MAGNGERKVILIKEEDFGVYRIGPCHICLSGNRDNPEYLSWYSGPREIIPNRNNPIEEHFIAMEKGHDYGLIEFIPKMLIAHSKEELKEKMYAQAKKLAGLISSRYKFPIEDRINLNKSSQLEMALETK